MTRRRQGRLFVRLSLTLGGSLILAFAVAATLSIGIGTRALGRSVEQELAGIAHLVHLDIERFLIARQAELQLCSEFEVMDDVVLGDSHFRIQNELMRLSRTYPGIYDELAVTSLSGEVVASTRVERIGTPLAVDPLGLLVRDDGARLGSGPQRVPGASRPVLVMAHEVRSSLSHQQTGWLVGLVRWSAVGEVLRGTPVVGRTQGPDAFLVLMRENEAIAGNSQWLPDRIPGDQRDLIRNKALEHEDPLHYTGNETFVELAGGAHPAGWHVVFYRDAGEAFGAVRVFAWSILAAGVFGLLLAGVLSLRIAREFTRRVDHLTQGTQRLATGDYTHRVLDAHDDELSQLGDAFNQMAESIRTAQESIEHSNAELEESNRRLREASKLKDEFLANTSHELRTPLNGILGFLGLVSDGLCDTPEEERHTVRQALECGQQLRVLIEDVLDVSRIEAGRLTMSVKPVRAIPALEAAVSEMSPKVRARGLELVCAPIADDALAFRADAQRLHQVLRHLLDNAIKFTEHGTVTLACTADEPAGFVRFEVRDTGLGIALERQAHVFERFVQGDGSATRRFGGTGLGLSLVRDLVEMMGGVVWLTSAGVGRGTTVTFTLPFARPDTSTEEENVSREHGGTLQGPAVGPLALLVEDDRVFTAWLRTVLHADGIRTVAADSAERAWMMLRQLRPSIVILDHALPAGASARFRTGSELARQMAETRSTADIPVVLLSGHDLVALEGPSSLPAEVQYLRKPVARETLLSHVWRMIVTHKPRSVDVMLAHRDPRLLAMAGQEFPASQFRVSLERNDDSCLEAVRLRPRTFDVVLLEVPPAREEALNLLRGFATLEVPMPLVAIAAPGVLDDAVIAEALRAWPVMEVFSTHDALANPNALCERLLALGGAAARLDDDIPANAA